MTNKQPTFLIVKLSSLGDVLHNLPIVWDIRDRYPDAHIDWIVEEAYVDLLRPLQTTTNFKGIDQIISIALRRWKRDIFNLDNWKKLYKLIQHLKSKQYDFVIDTQGLIKSAIVASLAGRSKKIKITGLANAPKYSGYEPLARFFYTESVRVPKNCHAVDCSRYLISSALNISLINRNWPITFYPNSFVSSLNDGSNLFSEFKNPYVLCFHATAKIEKKWSINNWVAVGKYVFEMGFIPIYPWGNQAEKDISKAIVEQLPLGHVPRAYTIKDYFGIISRATLVIGVDTGLTHLAAVLNRPTVEIYCNSPLWKTEGYWSDNIINLGDIGEPPSAKEVTIAIDRLFNT